MRVLVVEDERRLAAGLRAGLEAEGFAVDVALDGTDGLWLAREQPYDVIVLDLMLPGMDGRQLCATLRDERNWTPVLVLTARDGERDEVEALDTGADDYLTKPFSYGVLLARLRALLRRGARERPAVLSAGDLRLDPAARRAWRGADELALTARELALLELPAPPARRGGVQTRHPRPRVGLRLRGRPEHRRGLRGPAAGQARPAVRPGGDRDRPRVRLPAGGRWRLTPAGWRRRRLRRGTGTIRVRATAAALLVVALAMGAGAVALVLVLRAELTREVEAAARVRAPGGRGRAGGRVAARPTSRSATRARR